MAYNKTWDEPWKDGQTRRQFAVEKHNAGWTHNQIGNAVGKKKDAVWQLLSRMSLIESPSVVGATADDSPVDLKEIHRRLRALQAKTEAFHRSNRAFRSVYANITSSTLRCRRRKCSTPSEWV